MEEWCAGTHTQQRGIQEKACKAQRFRSCVFAVMVMWSLKNNLEKIWIGLFNKNCAAKTHVCFRFGKEFLQ
jgi:hypothetical protein